MPEHVLSFVYDGDGQLLVHADRRGLDLLINRLTRLRDEVSSGSCPHEHLFTNSWGTDGELSETALPNEGTILHHVKLYGWTPEWTQKHGLAV